jgi:hypothetical protein
MSGARQKSTNGRLSLSQNSSATGKKRLAFDNSLKPSRNEPRSRISPMTKRVIFSRWRTGLGSTPILWIRFLIFLRRSMNSFGPRARTGG